MPPQQANPANNNVLAKIDARVKAAVMSVASKPVENTGLDELPPGIRNGICQIVTESTGFFTTKPESNAKKADGTSAAGEPYFQATGVIVEPEYVEHEGRRIKVKGRQTRLYVPLYDTKDANGNVTTLEQHLGAEKGADGRPVVPAKKNVVNELKKLGAPPELFAKFQGSLMKVVEVVGKARPYFKFNTSERKNQTTGKVDGAWENWNGNEGLEGYSPSGPAADQVLDESAHVPAGAAPRAAAAASAPANQAASPPPPPPPVATPPAGEYRDDTDLDSLLDRATRDGNDEADAKAACDALRAAAKTIGKTDADVDGADGWEDVVGWIKAGGTAAAAPQQAAGGGAENPPALEDVYLYALTPGSKPVEVEVKSVNMADKTVQIMNLDTKKMVQTPNKKAKNVPWAELINQGS